MKYEFTGEVKLIYGLELKQIKASISFGAVSAGDIGGWIEGEKNLSQFGNAWVSGNAKVFGNANVFGNASKTPVCISGLNWCVTITDDHIRIGCKFHLISDWMTFSDEKISSMSEHALDFWKKNKNIIFGIIENRK